MTATSYPEFKKLFDRIPKERLPFVHFIPIRCGSKVPIGNWKGKAHLTLYECKDVLKTGGNIAVAGIPKGLMFLDIDIKEYPNGIPKELQDKIPNTFTVKTRSGGLHYYFLNNGDWDNQKFNIDGKEVGELRTNWQYIIACGSWVEPETYRCINDVPINQFIGDITVYFRNGNVKDLSPNRPAPTEGKVGKPLSDKHKELLERMKSQKEGKIESDKISNTQRKQDLLSKLASRGIKI